MTAIHDEQLYLEATQEVDNGTQASALWAMALAEGDEGKAKCRHIALRVEQRPTTSKKTPSVEPSGSPELKAEDKPIPKGWVPLVGDDSSKRIEKIKRGEEAGFISNTIWHVPANYDSLTAIQRLPRRSCPEAPWPFLIRRPSQDDTPLSTINVITPPFYSRL